MNTTAKLPAVKPGDRAMLEWYLGNVNVGTSEEDIRADILRRAERARKTMACPDQYVEALVECALEIHRANRALYVDVMSGNIGNTRKPARRRRANTVQP